MRRARLFALIAVVVVVFLFVSAVFTRVWSSGSAEQSAVTTLLKAEARGDATGMIVAIKGCSKEPACRARALYDAAHLKRPGHVSILQYTPSTGFSFGSTFGSARIAWEIIDHTRPITQCVRVRRSGNAVTGIHIELLEITRRIKTDGDCPKSYF